MGTTVVVFITTGGIVISSDSKAVLRTPDFAVAGEEDRAKFVILKKRIVVGTVGLGSIKNASFQYDFLAWMDRLDRDLPTDVSVDDVVSVIEKESPAAFATFYAYAFKNGAIKRNFADEACQMVVHFVVAGYQNGAPRIYEVKFDIDWNSQTFIGPNKFLLYSDVPKPSDYLTLAFGIHEAITDPFNRESYAHQKARTLCPNAIAELDARKYPSFNETIALSRALIQVEESTNPNVVGGPVRTAKILPDGRAEEVVITTALPECKVATKKK